MTLSIRWKVALAILFALLCGFVIAGLLAARSLAEQELVQSGRALEVSTNLIAFDLRPLLAASASMPATARLQAIVRELSERAHARVTLVDGSGRRPPGGRCRRGLGRSSRWRDGRRAGV